MLRACLTNSADRMSPRFSPLCPGKRAFAFGLEMFSYFSSLYRIQADASDAEMMCGQSM